MDLENERLSLPRLAVLYSSLAMHFVSLAFMDHVCSTPGDVLKSGVCRLDPSVHRRLHMRDAYKPENSPVLQVSTFS